MAQRDRTQGDSQEETEEVDEAGIPDGAKKLGRVWQDKKLQKFKEGIRHINCENLKLVFIGVK